MRLASGMVIVSPPHHCMDPRSFVPFYGYFYLVSEGEPQSASSLELQRESQYVGLSSITVIVYKIIFSDCVFPPKSNSSMIEAPWLLSLALRGEKEHCDSCAGPLETYSPFPKPPRGEKSKPVSPSSWGSTKSACLSACSNEMCYVGI